MVGGDDEDRVIVDAGVVDARLAHRVSIVGAAGEDVGRREILRLSSCFFPFSQRSDLDSLAAGFWLGVWCHGLLGCVDDDCLGCFSAERPVASAVWIHGQVAARQEEDR